MLKVRTSTFDSGEVSDRIGGMVAFVDPQSLQIIECNDPLSETLGVTKSQIVGKGIFNLFSAKTRKTAKKAYQTFQKTQSVPDTQLELKNAKGPGIPVTLRLSGTQDKQGQLHCAKFSWHNISQLKNTQRDVKRETRQVRGQLALGLHQGRIQGKTIRQEVEKRKTTEAQLRKTLTLLRRQAKETRTLARRLISVQEEERRRLARDLHDETNQKLALLSLQVASLKQGLPLETAELKARLQGLIDNISSLANEVRHLAHQLHPAVLEHLGFIEAIQAYVSEISHTTGIDIIFYHHNIPRTISLDLSLCLYRITQECLGNAIKHAQARTIHLSFVGLAKNLRFSIKDDGVGMTPKKFRNFSQGLGFVSMRERIRLVKGRLRITSTPQHGTEIHITIPRPETQS